MESRKNQHQNREMKNIYRDSVARWVDTPNDPIDIYDLDISK